MRTMLDTIDVVSNRNYVKDVSPCVQVDCGE